VYEKEGWVPLSTCDSPEEAEAAKKTYLNELERKGFDDDYRVFWLPIQLPKRVAFRVFLAKNL
jgi:hypothetical protein